MVCLYQSLLGNPSIVSNCCSAWYKEALNFSRLAPSSNNLFQITATLLLLFSNASKAFCKGEKSINGTSVLMVGESNFFSGSLTNE